MYKKIYIEITNRCNLNCDFCIKNSREVKYMSIDEFKLTLSKIKAHTKYLYFHVLGEPLLHPQINEFIEIAHEDFFINITTNGYLISNLSNSNIRQINISLHSFDSKYNISIEEYLNNIFSYIDKYKNKTIISLRFWINNHQNLEMLNLINNKFNTSISVTNIKDKIKLDNNVYISLEEQFIWPDLNNSIDNEIGTCYGLRDHFGILVDGTIIPCCLDSKGIINLGNIFRNNLDEILEQDRVMKMKNGFLSNKRIEQLCKKCGYNIKSKL